MALDLESYATQIPAGQSLSPAVRLGVKTLVGLSFDGAWVAPTGGVTFQITPDGGVTWQELYDGQSGNAVAVPVGAAVANRFVAMSNPSQWASVNMIKVRSGTAAAPVNQSSATVVTVFVRIVSF